jgi:hypothetical protein
VKQNVPLELHIAQAIIRRLREIPGVIVRKRHGTAMGVGGDPDLYGTISGRHFEIEVKRPDPSSRLTPLQSIRIEQWRQAGALVGVARSVEEALEIILPARVGAGRLASACARELVRKGLIGQEVCGSVTHFITTMLLAFGWQEQRFDEEQRWTQQEARP